MSVGSAAAKFARRKTFASINALGAYASRVALALKYKIRLQRADGVHGRIFLKYYRGARKKSNILNGQRSPKAPHFQATNQNNWIIF
jgi:hypothetical protein